MKRHSTKTVQESADKRKCSRPTAVSTTTSTAMTTRPTTTTTTTTSQAASSADVTTAPAAAAGSARQRRFTAKRALEMLQNLPDTDSGSDDSETNDERSDSSVHLSAARSQDDDDDDVASQTDAESTSRTTVTVPPTKATTDTDGQTAAKDGTKWKVVTQTALTGRFQTQNVFTAKPGPTAYARTVVRPVDAFRLLIDEGMLRHIKRCTVEYAQTKQPSWDMTDTELDIFLGLLYLRGVMNAKNFPVDLLWSDEYGCQAFRLAMPRNCFREIEIYQI